MRTGSNCHTVKINSCPSEHYWYHNNIGSTIIVSESGDKDEWHICTGEHEGKHVLKSVCSTAEMTLIDMTPSFLELEESA